VITEVKKDLPIPAGKIKKIVKEVEVKTVKVTKASLSKLTKVKLEEFALATYGVDIDRRKKKEDLVKEVLKLSKKV
jgi:BMFP domain-containing protein YqiC